jgi:hypothetical protein
MNVLRVFVPCNPMVASDKYQPPFNVNVKLTFNCHPTFVTSQRGCGQEDYLLISIGHVSLRIPVVGLLFKWHNLYRSRLYLWFAETKNAVEQWHSRFQKMIVTHHASVWKFLEPQNVQRGFGVLILQLSGRHT